jgi:flagellar biosynthesis protein FlhA
MASVKHKPLIDTAAIAELGVPIAVLGIVIALITPIPPLLLDLLLVIDVMVSVVVLMVAMYISKPVDFNVFPTTLLLLTLFRLTLNISATRLILMNGSSGTRAAGDVIEAFGNFVVGGNYVIGAVIFLTLIAIQFVVINHGAVRISEVTARFTLDALPGKQMAIDSDLSAGLIDERDARERRKQLSREAEFYGAMDGASRFTQRDAVACILITSINIVGGFLVGVLQHGMELKQALQTYTVLTIGDGLVTVLPALMTSIAGGLIVTRTGSDEKVGTDFRKQVFGAAQPLLLSSGVLVILGLFPGLPTIPFFAVGGLLGTAGWRMRNREIAAAVAPPPARPAEVKENLERLLHVEPLSVEVGPGLVQLVTGGPSSTVMKRVAAIRRELATDMGLLLPSIQFTDNVLLRAQEYTVLLKGSEIARYELPHNCELAISNGREDKSIEGRPTREPAFGMPALWVSPAHATAARTAGYTVVDPVSVLGTHLMEVIRRHAHELFSRQEAKRFLDRVAVDHPKVVEDLVPKLLPLATVHKVLQSLLREQVSIRDAVSILEAIGEAAMTTRNPVLLTEYVRQTIRRSIVTAYVNPNGALSAYFLDPDLEQTASAAVQHDENNSVLNVPPQFMRELIDRIRRTLNASETPVPIITSSAIRHFLHQFVNPTVPTAVFLSHNEIPPSINVVSLGVIR